MLASAKILIVSADVKLLPSPEATVICAVVAE
jgi:hypothetical protein